MLHTRNFLLILSPCCFAVCGHHLSPRIAIVFSLLSSVQNFSMPHSSIFISSNTSRSSLYISHSPTMWLLHYFFATRAHLCIFLLLSTTGIPCTYAPLLSGRGRKESDEIEGIDDRTHRQQTTDNNHNQPQHWTITTIYNQQSNQSTKKTINNQQSKPPTIKTINDQNNKHSK